MAIPDYRQNLDRASFVPQPPEMVELQKALRGNQEDTNFFFKAMSGLIPREEFFSPENMQRIMAKATLPGDSGQAAPKI